MDRGTPGVDPVKGGMPSLHRGRSPFQSLKSARASGWAPPSGWEQVGLSLIWQPKDYRPTQWELPLPRVISQQDADREYSKCTEGPNAAAYFCLHYCWTVDVDDPSGLPQPRRIPAFPYVRQFLIDNQPVRNVHTDKSRQMITSWLWMGLFLWDVLFHPAWPNLAMSRREDEVDDGGMNSTPTSLLGKVRHMWEHLPPFLAHRFEFKYMLVTNLDLGGYIKGETATQSAGRGPTVRRVLGDEFAHVPHADTIFRGIRMTAKQGTIVNSTPRGKSGPFYRIKVAAHTNFVKQSYHWSLHPERRAGLYCGGCGWKSTPWADHPQRLDERAQFIQSHLPVCRSKTPHMLSPWRIAAAQGYREEDIAQELEISYEKSQRGRVWSAFNILNEWDHTACIDKVTGYPIGEAVDGEDVNDYRYRYLMAALDPSLTCFVTMDPGGASDPASLCLGQIVDWDSATVRWLDCYQATGFSWDHFHLVMTYWMDCWSDVGGSAITAMRFTGDPAGKQRSSAAEGLRSWFSNLANAEPPVHVEMPSDKERKRVLEWLDYIQEGFRRGREEVSTFCAELIDAISQYHFPLDTNGDPVPGRHLPVHNEWSHYASAFRYAHMVFFADRLSDHNATGLEQQVILSMGDSTKDTREIGRIRF